MNANKLADELSKWTMVNKTIIDEAVAMLRQMGLAESIITQQKLEIESLKSQVKHLESQVYGGTTK